MAVVMFMVMGFCVDIVFCGGRIGSETVGPVDV